ncbi:MAG: UvrD-helicase domain-containing protein, partial [Bacteroidales bacterium]|nr:UvrD-helicase domain-containing protein [Bacteroidales bacterium]
PRDVLARISMAKNNLVTVSAYRGNAALFQQDSHARRPRLADVYEAYQRKLRQSGVMDFDDILLNMNILLRDNPAALEAIAARFSYVMVDEYQDTNFSQYLILKKLVQFHRNLCVVGDDSQSIYAFRGAKIENILHFRQDYPECRTFRLECNYRSTATIVEAANSLIAHNAGRIPKKCYAQAGAGERIRVLKAYSETEEASGIVAGILERMRRASAEYRDFAILYRTNAQSRALEEQLRRRNIPYRIFSGNSFFERAEVKNLMAYFKLAVNVRDDESFRRTVNTPARGIGETSVAALAEFARAEGLSLFDAALSDKIPQSGLKDAAVRKLQAFCAMVADFSARVPDTDAFVLATRIADVSGLYAFYQADTSVEGQARAANVGELLNSVSAFVEERAAELDEDSGPAVFTLDDFLEDVSLLSNVDVGDEEDASNKVALMTVHSAKGLEFPYVTVAGMEENLFPSASMLLSPADIEEERRLFYVAMTRAGKALTLSYALTRMRNGKHESNRPSRFIREIGARYLENPPDGEDGGEDAVRQEWGGFGSRFTGGRIGGREQRDSLAARIIRGEVRPAPRPATPGKPALIDPDFVPVPMTELYVGERIEHNRFGPGVIKDISGTAPEMKAHIVFDEYGEKLLLLKYAKLRPEKK